MDVEIRIKIILPQDPINSTFILNFFNLPVHFTEMHLWKALSTLGMYDHTLLGIVSSSLLSLVTTSIQKI